MSVTSIPDAVKIRLWGKAAGCCQYEGCKERLWLDSLTKAEFNAAYIAHIVADSPNGPRGDPVLSDKLKDDISNLMLMCDKHHRLVDKGDAAGHPVERLKAMKAAHERRIDILSQIGIEKQSHILLYGANIGTQSSPVSYAEAARAMVPDRYPAEQSPLSLSLVNSSFEDRDRRFWEIESAHLQTMVTKHVQPRLKANEISHLSIFALAPQPLLVLLGSLLSDIPAAEVYQLKREPRGWRWEEEPQDFRFLITEPQKKDGLPALAIALSATVNDDRIFAVLGTNTSIWRVTIPSPHNDFLRSRRQAQAFREQMRQLMNQMKTIHGETVLLHVFPAMPVALAVDFGRILMPKADLSLRIYDENKQLGGFIHALDVNPRGTR
jgi:SMODS-associated and fused to various effectors sensor domain